MEHLFASKVQLLRPTQSFVNGQMRVSWDPVSVKVGRKMRTEFYMRIDLTFQPARPGQPLVIEAGTTPDREGTGWANPQVGMQMKPGDRVLCVGGPITGTFSIEDMPDQVGDFDTLHHIEVGLKEVAQAVDGMLA